MLLDYGSVNKAQQRNINEWKKYIENVDVGCNCIELDF